ncbi:BLUF domain-containing protein [Salegentibacter flavus]|uniref:Sensors of blue-light using FAD n=1 Tax=Salegentibacter flavus TaxID=287099 RepID=A0A1I4ZAT0_9FLAO|nr:BLUF domain-containing protein [Salegentibacter flavus]SFN47113.1 Sensors of blue-light using FAD [Salegentibacter flavus]
MRYAISYVSTANKDLTDPEVTNIMKRTMKFNRNHDISGILLYNENNFFQLLEGEKQTVLELYKIISEDSRHYDIIKFLEKPIFNTPFDGYLTEFITDIKRCDESTLEKYQHYLKVLNPGSQKSMKRVLEVMMV